MGAVRDLRKYVPKQRGTQLQEEDLLTQTRLGRKIESHDFEWRWEDRPAMKELRNVSLLEEEAPADSRDSNC